MLISKRTSTMFAAGLGVSILGLTAFIQLSDNLEMRPVVVDGKNLEIVKKAVQSVGGDISYELRFVKAVGAHLTDTQVKKLQAIDGIRQVYPNSGVNSAIADSVARETIISQISSNNDDAEEEYSGKVYLSPNRVIADDNGYSDADQTVGLRFNNLMIPQGAIITNAVITFKAMSADGDNTNSENVSFFIEAQYDDNVSSFSNSSYDVSSRPKTAATVDWVPSPLSSKTSYNTPNLATMVQEVVDRSGWINGNSMAFFIIGSGSRSTSSYEEGVVPELTIQYELPATANAVNDAVA